MSELEFVTQPTARLVSSHASDDDAAMAAWVSFDRDSEDRLENRKQVEGLLNFLMRENHTSPFEHGYFKFRIDCPIFVAREFHRHRTFSYNEVSGRYTEMKPRFYVPGDVRPVVQQGKAGKYFFTQDEPLNKVSAAVIEDSARESWENYQWLLSKGVAKEVARMVLPLTLMTQFYASVDPLNLMKFLDLRTTPQALWEIRDVAEQMEEHLEDQMPLTYAAWNKKRDLWREFMAWNEARPTIQAGEVIGHVGTTARSTGVHIHVPTTAPNPHYVAVQSSFDRGRA